jgi:hypothetical protein
MASHGVLPTPALKRPVFDATPMFALTERVERAPLDAAACFELAIQHLRHGSESEAVRFLGRAVRIHPALLLSLLQDPIYEKERGRPVVRRLLWSIKRAYDRRIFTAYA